MAEKKYYVASTLAAAVDYQVVSAGGGDLHNVDEHIVIQGGANIPDKYMRTPEGAVITPVTEAQYEALKANPVFQLHEKNGFIKVTEKKVDGEKAAADMEGRDNSAPLVDQDFAGDQQPIPNGGRTADEPPAPVSTKSNSRRA